MNKTLLQFEKYQKIHASSSEKYSGTKGRYITSVRTAYFRPFINAGLS